MLAEQETASNIFVLDDVTPCYLAASVTLKACDAGLAATLDRLLDSEDRTRILS
jgi:hypothetical protein